METLASTETSKQVMGPPKLASFSHVALPCRDLEEGKRFYGEVLGGELVITDGPTFAAFCIGGVDIGIGTQGTSYITPGNEYPHIGFFCGPDELIQMKQWLAECGIPTSNLWTRGGVEALMFFRDPSGNMIEFYCERGVPGADKFPRGPARGHGTAVDIDKLRYTSWKLP